MFSASRWELLNSQFPEIEMGRHDAANGKWRDIVGHDKSFAYEVGRMTAFYPVAPCQYGGFVDLAPEIEQAVLQLQGAQ